MIASDRQLKVTTAKLAAIEQRRNRLTLNKKSATPDEKIAPEFIEASRVELEELAEELRAEIREYQRLRREGIKAVAVTSPADMILLPMKYRIACGLTQEQFAAMVGVSLRQIARYEAESYQNINGETLRRILERLPLRLDCEIAETGRPRVAKRL